MAKIFEILTFPFLQQNSLDSVDLGLSSFYLHSFYNTHTMNTYTVAHLGTHTHTHTFTSTSSHASTLTHTYTLSVLFVSFAASHSVSLFLFIPFLPVFLSHSHSQSRAHFLTFPFPFSSILILRVSLVRGHFISILGRGQFSKSNKKNSREKWKSHFRLKHLGKNLKQQFQQWVENLKTT